MRKIISYAVGRFFGCRILLRSPPSLFISSITMKIRSFKSFLNSWLSRAAGVLILQSIFIVPCGSVWGDTTWTWTNTGTGGQWNNGDNWSKAGDATTSYPERYSSNQTINITAGTANNSAIDLDFSTTTINISGTGALSQTTTHHSRMYTGALNVTDGGSLTMRANGWHLGWSNGGAIANAAYSVKVDGGTFNYTGGDLGLYLGEQGATTTVTIQQSDSAKATTFSLAGPTYLGYGVVPDGKTNAGTASTGTINMSAGTATFTNTLYIGSNGGTGVFNQTGGTATAGTIVIGNAASSLNVGTGAALTTAGITNSGTVTQTGTLTLLNGATINSYGGTYTAGGAVKLANGYTIAENSVIHLGKFSNSATAQAFHNSLDSTTTAGKTFRVQSVSGVNGDPGLSILYAANEGTTINDQMILLPGTSGQMSNSANWDHYDSAKTGLVLGGTNTLTDMFTSVEVSGGTNSYSVGFVIGSAANTKQSLTISGGKNNFGKQLIIGNGANTSGELTIKSAVTMTADATGEKQVFIGISGGTGSMAINAGGSLNTNSSEDFVIAMNDNSTGTLTINGGSLTHSGNFIVGGSNGGKGTLIMKSGTFSGPWMSVGQLSNNAEGELIMTGGTLTASSGFRVGIVDGCKGTATISGGTVTTGSLSVAETNEWVKTASGKLTLSGTGRIDVGAVKVGGGTKGELFVTGGTLAATGATTIYGTGTLAISGGTISTTGISNAGTLILMGGDLSGATSITNTDTGTVVFKDSGYALPTGLTFTNNGGTIAVTGYSMIDLSAAAFTTTGGAYTINSQTPKTGDSYVAAKVANAEMATNFLTLTKPDGWQYSSAQIDSGTYIFASYGQASAAGKIWKSGETGSMSDSTKWENYSADAVGYVISGTNTFNDIVGKTVVQGGTNSFTTTTGATPALTGGAELTLAGGVNTVQSGSTFNIGVGGGVGTLNVSGGVNSVSVMDTHVGLQGGKGVINQTGGSTSWTGWLNIGETTPGSYTPPEGYAGSYYLSGGTMTTNGILCVGRRGSGYLEISGTGVLEAKTTTYIGFFPGLTADSELKMTGGSASFASIYVGNNLGNVHNGTYSGTSRMTVEGGAFTTSSDVYVSFTGSNGLGGKAILTIANEGAENTIGGVLYIGNGANTDGTVNISNGTTTFKNILYVGNGAGSNGTLNVSGGTTTALNEFYVGYQGGTGVATVSGGVLNLYKTNTIGSAASGTFNMTGGEVRCLKLDSETNPSVTKLGSGTTGSGTMTISGGTFYAANSDFFVGHDGAAAVLTVKGTFDNNGALQKTGTFNQNGKGNLVICATEANGGAGSIVNLEKGGVIDVLWFSMGQNVYGSTNPTCTFNMTGGELKIGTGNFRIVEHENATKAFVNLSGGKITVTGNTILDVSGRGSELNVIGPNIDFQGNTANLRASGFVNYSVGTLTADNIAAGKLLSELKFSGAATVASTVNIDMSVDGLIDINSVTPQTIFTAGSLTWSPQIVNISQGWTWEREGNSIVVSLLESELPTSDVAMGLASIVGSNLASGVTKISGTPGETFNAGMSIIGASDEQMNLLDAWMELQTGKTVTVDGSTLLIEGLTIDEPGYTTFSFGLGEFNLLNGTDLKIGDYQNPNVPEPSTWLLLILGSFGLAFYRKNAARR